MNSHNSNGGISRFDLLPSDLRKVITFLSLLAILNIISGISFAQISGFVNLVLAIIYIILIIGLYNLKSWARTVTIYIMIVAVFFGLISFIIFILGIVHLIRLSLSFGDITVLIGGISNGIIIPAVNFYVLYLIANEDVKQYFMYPEMVENSKPNPRPEKEEKKKEYRSFGDALD